MKHTSPNKAGLRYLSALFIGSLNIASTSAGKFKIYIFLCEGSSFKSYKQPLLLKLIALRDLKCLSALYTIPVTVLANPLNSLCSASPLSTALTNPYNWIDCTASPKLTQTPNQMKPFTHSPNMPLTLKSFLCSILILSYSLTSPVYCNIYWFSLQ